METMKHFVILEKVKETMVRSGTNVALAHRISQAHPHSMLKHTRVEGPVVTAHTPPGLVHPQALSSAF